MHWRYLKAVLRHKRFVFLAGVPLGVPLRQLVFHDWTKFGPTEWLGYARKFYGGHYPAEGWCKTIGIPFVGLNPLTKERVEADFNAAWLSHQKRNKHHWQWWVVMEDSGKVFCLAMPDRFRREMLADWRGANRAYGDTPLVEWYRQTMGARRLHDETAAWVEAQLGIAGTA